MSLYVCISLVLQEAIMKTEEKGSTKEKVDSMQKKYDVSIAEQHSLKSLLKV